MPQADSGVLHEKKATYTPVGLKTNRRLRVRHRAMKRTDDRWGREGVSRGGYE